MRLILGTKGHRLKGWDEGLPALEVSLGRLLKPAKEESCGVGVLPRK